MAGLNALLASVLTPDDAAAVAAELAKPINLDYEFYFVGNVAVEPETGAIVALEGVTEGIQVRPDLSGFTALQPRLAAYAGNPIVGAISGVLNGLQQARPVFQLEHAQTAASVAEMVDNARSSRDQKRLVEDTAPWVVMIVGILVYVGGLALALHRRPRPPAAPATVIELGSQTSTEPVSLPKASGGH
jgi:hypothetical protein